MLGVFQSMWQNLASKDWSLYPFIPPLFSLFLSLYLMPLYSELFSKNLKAYLDSQSLGRQFDIINAIAKDRGLQIASLTGAASFVASFVATLRSNHPVILTAGVIILLLVGGVLFLKIFLRVPGYHATTRFPEKRYPNFLYKRKWTYLDVYSKALASINLVLIIIIIIALPEK